MTAELSRKNFLRLSAAAVGALAAPGVATAAANQGAYATNPLGAAPGSPGGSPGGTPTGADGWVYVEEIKKHIDPPRFPRRTFSITDYGAVGDGTTLSTHAIAAAIEACTASGGGRVLVPAGTFLTGAVHLADNVDLHVSAGATLLFSKDPQHYLPAVHTRFEGIEMMGYSPFIYARRCTNIALTGSGTIDGGCTWEDWWSWVSKTSEDWARLQQMAADGVPVEERVFGEGSYLRPTFVETYECTDVLIEGVRVQRSPFWCIHPVLSRNVTVRNIHIDSTGPNNDGVNPESCRYVAIRGCTFDAGDDCIAVKSGREADGLRVNVPSEDILIERCTMRNRYGAITIGSEMTGGARNVFVRDCVIGSPTQYFGLYVKTNSHRGGFAENIYLKDIEISNLTKEVVSANFYRGEGDTGPLTPRMRNVELRNVTVRHARNAFSMKGYPRSPIEDFRVVDCRFTVDAASTLADVDMEFQDFVVNGVPITDQSQL